MRIFSNVVGGLLLAASPVFAEAVTNDLFVAAGQTNRMAELVRDVSVTSGMTFRKTGPGVLLDDSVIAAIADTAVNIVVSEGVWRCTATGLYGKAGKLTVEDGACLCMGNNAKAFFKGNWKIFLAGQGTGTAPCLGAVVVDTSAMDALFNGNMTMTLTDDATIYGT